jgi:phosphoribosyl-dephospho-CoA transferase
MPPAPQQQANSAFAPSADHPENLERLKATARLRDLDKAAAKQSPFTREPRRLSGPRRRCRLCVPLA